MLRCLICFAAAIFAVGLGAGWLESDVVVAQTKAPKAAKFKAPAKTHGKIYHVQARQPHWRAVTIAPNPAVAYRIERALHHHGFRVQTRTNRLGQVAIRARMPYWHTRAIVPNHHSAQRIASILVAQGFQARIR
jgi:hypothetical protein